MFKKLFSFCGHIRRTEYAISYMVFIAFYFIVGPIIDSGELGGLGGLLGFLIIPIMWFLLAQGAKRCHDFDRNAWWQLIPMFWIVLLVAKGNNENNKYGENQKVVELM